MQAVTEPRLVELIICACIFLINAQVIWFRYGNTFINDCSLVQAVQRSKRMMFLNAVSVQLMICAVTLASSNFFQSNKLVWIF